MLIPGFGGNTNVDFTSTDFACSFQPTLQLQSVLCFQGTHLFMKKFLSLPQYTRWELASEDPSGGYWPVDLHYPHLWQGSALLPHRTSDAPLLLTHFKRAQWKNIVSVNPGVYWTALKAALWFQDTYVLASNGHEFHPQVVILELLGKSILLPHFQSSTALLLFLGIGGKVMVSASELVPDFAFPVARLLRPRRNLLNACWTVASSA